MDKTVLEFLATILDQLDRIAKKPANERESDHWRDVRSDAETAIARCAKRWLPSGSGIDCGTSVSLAHSRPDRLVMVADCHKMNDAGYYAGWSTYNVIVTPTLTPPGYRLRITGEDRGDCLEDYLHDLYSHALGQVLTREDQCALYDVSDDSHKWTSADVLNTARA